MKDVMQGRGPDDGREVTRYLIRLFFGALACILLARILGALGAPEAASSLSGGLVFLCSLVWATVSYEDEKEDDDEDK